MAVPLPRYRFSAEDFRAMVENGILAEDARVELIDGEIVEMGPIGPLHAAVVAVLTRLAVTRLGAEVVVRVQSPIGLAERDEPQPDLALVRPGDYRAAHPAPDDVVLVIEVADTSRLDDRETKLRRYAAAGVPEAWLVDLCGALVERHGEPRDGLYRQIAIGRPGEELASTVLAGFGVPVDLALGQVGDG